MTDEPFQVWDITPALARKIGLDSVLALDSPICWIGSEDLGSREFSAFEAAFESGDLAMLRKHSKTGLDTVYVVGGSAKSAPNRSLIAMCKSNSGTVEHDNIIRVNEIASLPAFIISPVPCEVLTEIDALRSDKSVWIHILKALWPFGRHPPKP